MVEWLLGFWELLKAVFLFGIFILFCFALMVVVLDALIVLTAFMYERWNDKK